MNYKGYQKSRDAAWRILLDCKVDFLPVNIVDICRQLGVSARLYSPTDGNDGISMIIDGKPQILVSSRVNPGRRRFTIAHELGHIVLGHVGRYALCNREPSPADNPVEHEANVFASRLLAPACVLWGCHAFQVEEIMELCKISRQAAEFRAKRMEILRHREKFLTSPLEREVFRRFEWFIKNHTFK